MTCVNFIKRKPILVLSARELPGCVYVYPVLANGMICIFEMVSFGKAAILLRLPKTITSVDTDLIF